MTKRNLRSRFLSFAPEERLECPSVSSDKNSVSQIDGMSLSKGGGIGQAAFRYRDFPLRRSQDRMIPSDVARLPGAASGSA
jgi:hypothetical protein